MSLILTTTAAHDLPAWAQFHLMTPAVRAVEMSRLGDHLINARAAGAALAPAMTVLFVVGAVVAQVLAVLAAGAVAVGAYRWVHRRATPDGVLLWEPLLTAAGSLEAGDWIPSATARRSLTEVAAIDRGPERLVARCADGGRLDLHLGTPIIRALLLPAGSGWLSAWSPRVDTPGNG